MRSRNREKGMSWFGPESIELEGEERSDLASGMDSRLHSHSRKNDKLGEILLYDGEYATNHSLDQSSINQDAPPSERFRFQLDRVSRIYLFCATSKKRDSYSLD